MIEEAKMVRMVCGFAFAPSRERSESQCVVLIRKIRGPSAVRGRLNGIGGHIEEGETPVEAMVREFHEEAGIQTLEENWGSPYVRLYGDGWEVNFFRHFAPLNGIKLGIHSVTDERVTLAGTMPLLVENLVPNLHWLIPLALDPCLDPELTIQVHDVT